MSAESELIHAAIDKSWSLVGAILHEPTTHKLHELRAALEALYNLVYLELERRENNDAKGNQQ